MNRSPGLDGLTINFVYSFRLFSIGSPLIFVVNKCFLRGSLPDSMKGSITHLIFRKRSDIKCLKNWRPISLLNVDYKFFSEVITSRLSKVLSFIIHPDKTFSIY